MRLEVASPCEVPWDGMTGSDRIRFCSKCRLNVYTLSEMTEGDARRLVRRTEGRLCVRLYRRADGTVVTKRCGVGWRRLFKRMAATAGLLVGIFAVLFAASSDTSRWSAERVAAWFHSLWQKDPPPQQMLMGVSCPPPPPPARP